MSGDEDAQRGNMAESGARSGDYIKTRSTFAITRDLLNRETARAGKESSAAWKTQRLFPRPPLHFTSLSGLFLARAGGASRPDRWRHASENGRGKGNGLPLDCAMAVQQRVRFFRRSTAPRHAAVSCGPSRRLMFRAARPFRRPSKSLGQPELNPREQPVFQA